MQPAPTGPGCQKWFILPPKNLFNTSVHNFISHKCTTKKIYSQQELAFSVFFTLAQVVHQSIVISIVEVWHLMHLLTLFDHALYSGAFIMTRQCNKIERVLTVFVTSGHTRGGGGGGLPCKVTHLVFLQSQVSEID